MKIKSVTGKNIKGRDFEHGLEALTYITGPNGSGKTSITDAIRLAGLGYHPALGKTNAATMQLAGAGPRMIASIAMEDGRSVTRQWTRKGKTVTKTEDGTDTVKIDLAALDWRLFMEANNTERAMMIRSRFAGTSDPRESIKKELQGVSDLPKLSYPTTTDLAEWLETLEDLLNDTRKDQAAVAKRMKETIQGLGTLQISDDDSGPVVTREMLNEHAAKMSKAIERFARAKRDVETLASNILTQQRAMANIEVEVDVPEDFEYAKAAEAIATLQREIGEINKTMSEIDATARKRAEARNGAAECERLILALQVDEDYVKGAEIGTEALQQKLADHQPANTSATMSTLATTEYQMRDAERAMEKAVAKLEAHKVPDDDAVCPHCGAEARHGDKTIRERLAAEHSKLESEANEAADKWEALKAAYKQASEAHDAAFASNQEREKWRTMLRAMHDMARLQADAKRHADGMAGPDVSSQELAMEIAEKESEIETLKQRTMAADYLAKRSEIEKIITGLQAQHNDASNELSIAQCDLNTEEANKIQLEKDFEAVSARAAESRRMEESNTMVAKAEAEAAACAAAINVLRTAGARVAEESLGPVLDLARHFSDGILPSQITARGLEIGRWDDATWIGIDTFSGSEAAITMAAIMAGLAQQSEARILILDEFGRIDEANQTKVIERIADAIWRGKIDQAIVINNRSIQLPALTEGVATATIETRR